GFAGQRERIEAALAVHYAAGSDFASAAACHENAASRALASAAYDEAVIHLEGAVRAVAALPQSPARQHQQLELLLRQANLVSHAAGQSSDQVRRLYQRAKALADALGDPASAFAVLRGVELYWRTSGDLESAARVADDLFRIAVTGERVHLQEAYRIRGSIDFWAGALSEAQRHFDQSLALSRELSPGERLAGGQETWVRCLGYQATLHWLRGYPDAAVAAAEQAIELARRSDSPPLQVMAQILASWTFVLRRDHARVAAMATEARRQALECGFGFWASVATIMLGWATAAAGEGRAGVQVLQAGLETYQSLGAGRPTVDFYLLLADTYLGLGDAAAGLQAIDDAERMQPRFRQRYFAAELHRLRGELLRIGSSDQQRVADRCFGKALALARAQGARALELRAAVSLARLHLERGSDEGVTTLARVASQWPAAEESFDWRQARQILSP
ncbi:MAG TPA: hypothetical protein VEB21_18310, partial [Terriglobales bacterium]|nr:hypothetical protein [Terriglobales bacterium]